ncbi:MAG: hypothetical protein FJW23_16665 [Acidimicrobiia bacterium]|nr:hypothetical protein [Acidimicrobiia bacterium]
MTGPQAGFERRVYAALDATPSRIPVILGACGTGRTHLLGRLAERAPRGAVQHIDVERCATTPERLLAAVAAAAPFPWHGRDRVPESARDAFDMLLAFLDSARAPGGEPCLFLLDEALDLRTFESFPGLRHVMRDLLEALSASANRFVLTSRYVARTHRFLRDSPARFEVMHLPLLPVADVIELLAPSFDHYERTATDDRDFTGRAVQALTDGRAGYARALGDAMARQRPGPADPVAALTQLLAPGAELAAACRFSYELRLHRARGYGALKGILDILADEEPLTLTEVSHRLRRTPGSTKDYLSWLEDVDLITARQKRYTFTDPLMRLWVRLHCRTTPPSMDEVARDVQRYAAARMPSLEPAAALAYAGGGDEDASADERKSWGIIEID